jgi:hypothetical protein
MKTTFGFFCVGALVGLMGGNLGPALDHDESKNV